MLRRMAGLGLLQANTPLWLAEAVQKWMEIKESLGELKAGPKKTAAGGSSAELISISFR